MISKGVFEVIREHEGFEPEMYLDAANLPTIGYGTLIDTKEEEYLLSATINREEAEELMLDHLRKEVEPTIKKYVRVPLNQNETDSLASFIYNIGSGNFAKSTLLRKLNGGYPREEVADEMLRWNKAGGKVLNGLIRRRKDERALFLGEMLPTKKKD